MICSGYIYSGDMFGLYVEVICYGYIGLYVTVICYGYIGLYRVI